MERYLYESVLVVFCALEQLKSLAKSHIFIGRHDLGIAPTQLPDDVGLLILDLRLDEATVKM